jgi:tetratricopeptide (TPR) repeat protein
MGLGQVDRALFHFREARSAAALTDDKVDLALAQSNVGIQCQYAGQFRQARAELERAIVLYREAAADQRAANAMLRLGHVLLAEGEIDGALDLAVQGRALATEAQDRWGADCYDLLGAIDALRARWASAESYYAQALQLRERADHRAGRIESLLGLGLTRERRGDWPGARSCYVEALDHARSMDPCPWLLAALRHTGQLFFILGEQAAARQLLSEVAALVDEMAQTEEFAPAQLVLVACGWFQTDAAALAAIDRALAAGATMELRIELHAARARLLQVSGRHARARLDLSAAVQLSQRLGSPRTRALAELTSARQARADDDRHIATTWFEAALASAKEASTPYEQVLVLQEFAASGCADAERSRLMQDEASTLLAQLTTGEVLVSSEDRATICTA